MADSQKSLPAVPVPQPQHNTAGTSGSNLTTLTIDSREHLSKFIQAAFLEEGVLDARKSDVWEERIKRALDGLGESVGRGGWLSGIKRNRLKRKKRVNSTTAALEQIRELLAKPAPPLPKPAPKHLLLCIAPLVPLEDSGFDIVAANVGCSFQDSRFSLDNVISGLREWEVVEPRDSDPPRLVGGTFTFKGLSSPTEYNSLTKILRLAVHVYLSLLLEQQFFADSNVALRFPPLRLSLPALPPFLSPQSPLESRQSETRHRTRHSLFSGAGLMSFLSKKAGNLGYRLPPATILGRGPSLENSTSLPLSLPGPTKNKDGELVKEPSSPNVDGRVRRFSFRTDSLAFLKQPHSPSQSASGPTSTSGLAFPSPSTIPELANADENFYSNTLSNVARSLHLMTTSTNVRFPLPLLLVRLALREKEREKKNFKSGKLRITGDERTGLECIVGWEENSSDRVSERGYRGKGMTGIRGFLAMQEFSVLMGSNVIAKKDSDAGAREGSSVSGASEVGGTIRGIPLGEGSVVETLSKAKTKSEGKGNERGKVGTACDRPRWRTFVYYSRQQKRRCRNYRELGGDESTDEDRDHGEDSLGKDEDAEVEEEDPTLGEFVLRVVGEAGDECGREGCKFRKGDHRLRMIHGGIGVCVEVEEEETERDRAMGKVEESRVRDGDVRTWIACKVCGKRTESVNMSDGTFLFSFAKFLELLVYSPSICVLSPELCEHTTPPKSFTVNQSDDDELARVQVKSKDKAFGADSSSSSFIPPHPPPLPPSRMNITRHFSYQSRVVVFGLEDIGDVYEVRVPRLQIVRGCETENQPAKAEGGGPTPLPRMPLMNVTSTPGTQERIAREEEDREQEEKSALKKEIKAWWQGLSDQIDGLEKQFVSDEGLNYEKTLPRLPPPSSSGHGKLEDSTPPPTPTASDQTPGQHASLKVEPLPPLPPSTSGSLSQKEGTSYFTATASSTDSSLSTSTSRSDASSSSQLLSKLRNTFQKTEQGLYVQLARTPGASLNDVRRAFHSAANGTRKRLVAWQKKHLPKVESMGQKLLLNEPEWWSKECHAVPGGNVIVREDDWGSIIAFTLGTNDYQMELASFSHSRTSVDVPPPIPTPSSSTSSSFPSPHKLFHSASRNTPDPDQDGVIWHEPEAYSAVISRKEHPRDPTSLLSIREVLRNKNLPDGTIQLASRFAGALGTVGSKNAPIPPMAYARPAVEVVTKEAADGEVNGLPEKAGGVGKILHDMEAASESSHSATSSSSMAESVDTVSSSVIEAHIRRGKASSIISASTGSDLGSEATVGPENQTRPPTPPSKELEEAKAKKDAGLKDVLPPVPDTTTSSFANQFTNSFSHAVRYMFKPAELRPNSPSPRAHHGLLSVENLASDDRPHIKHDWTIGKRLKFSCTVYYAKQFDQLRKKCGINDVFLNSLRRSANWAAEGGKSKSNFWKTSDDYLIIKTLVNGWAVADLQVLIELGPSYFRYMDATAGRPTVLAKLLGFYTVEIRNLESGAVQAKADLLVMENLFYRQRIVKTFDLKGIQGRKVKPTTSGTQNAKTLFDGEWIEGQQKTLTLIRPHSKVVLHEAIKSDCEFLARSNIMDYSLLLGVDIEKKQIACGLVDTIGSYTFAKTIEHKAKQGLNSGKEVTVVPPAEYQERFLSALDGYFLACPDKWSNRFSQTKITRDIDMLPSVL